MRQSDTRLLEQIQNLLASDRPEADLLAAFEAFGRDAGLDRHFVAWAPALYARNPVRFRPFILSHLSSFLPWNERIEGLLDAADEANDTVLFRRLFERKVSGVGWEKLEGLYREELDKRFTSAASPAARDAVFQKFTFEFALDEPLALKLYETEPEAAGPYILQHLPYQGREESKLWETLFDAALARGDDTFAFALYRDQAPYERWKEDVAELVRSDRPPDVIVAELEKRHARSAYFTNGDLWDELVRRHGEVVLGFVGSKVSSTQWQADQRDGLIDLAEANGWWGFWARLVRDGSDREAYNARIDRLLRDGSISDAEKKERLRLIPGPREGHYGYATPLTAAVSRLLYESYPELYRRDFRPHISRYGREEPELLDFFLERDDEELVDFFASEIAIRLDYDYRNYREPPKPPAGAERLVAYYRTILDNDPKAFAARANGVLGQIQLAYSPKAAIARNPLARLFFGIEPHVLLTDETAVQDLVETENDWLRAVALRAIAADDERALTVTRRCFPLLAGMMLQVMTRDARRHLHRALENLGKVEEDKAAVIVARCRAALDMAPTSIPKDEMAALLAKLLHRWPSLRSPREALPVYERVAVSS